MRFHYRNFNICGALKKETELIMYAIDYSLIKEPTSSIELNITKSNSKLGDNVLGFYTGETLTVKRRPYCLHNGSWMSTLVHELMHVRQVNEKRLIMEETAYCKDYEEHVLQWYEIEANALQLRYRREVEFERLDTSCYFVNKYTSVGILLA